MTDVLVVVNGQSFDNNLLHHIRSIKCVRVLMVKEAGIANARLQGRLNVSAPHFLMLDDDDELLPNAVGDMLAAFRSAPEGTGLVLADSYNTGRRGKYGFVPSPSAIEDNPLDALTRQNWLILQSTLFRTVTVPPEVFKVETLSNECTLIAYKICVAGIGVKVLDSVVATVHFSPNLPSESKTEHFITQEPIAIKQLLALDLPIHIKNRLNMKLGAAHHYNAEYFLRQRKFRHAWRSHLASLITTGGLRYNAFTRYLLVPGSVRSPR